jgi:RHS repeat-associated protein
VYHNQVGRLAVSSVPGWGFCMGYDLMGRLLDKDLSMSVPAGTLYLDYSYDLLGNITSQTAGYGSATYSYNTAGRPITVTSSYSDPNNPATVFSGAHYNAFGGLTSDTLGNNETETYSYVPHLTRLQSYTSKLNTTTNYNFNITSFAPNGDILAATDTANGNWTYTYDPFNRLVGSNKNSGQAVYSYVYDRFGNRWQQNGPQAFLATFTGNNPGNPQNNNRMDGYSYDAAGNLLNDGTHSYTYDAENRLLKVDNGSTATYTYDADGNRVQKVSTTGSGGDPAGTWQFLYDQSGRMTQRYNGTLWQGNIYVGGRHLVEDGGGTNFSHADWLGTERVRTTNTGAVCESIASLPFGDGQTTTGACYHSSPLHFTGKERDFESGLDYFGARFDSSSMGRFLSADETKYSSKSDPQSWNLYSYVGNNPLGRIDPDGHNYFWINGKYEWHNGNTYSYKDEHQNIVTLHSDYNYVLVVTNTGRTTPDGANIVKITLKGPGDQTIIQANGFSGGNVEGRHHNRATRGRYEINLNKRGGTETNKWDSANDLHAWHDGIQEIAEQAAGAPKGYGYQGEWGTMRANLTPLDGQSHQFYLHGKQVPRDSTHGCICDRSEAVLHKIFDLNPGNVGEGTKRGIIAVSVQ